MKTSAERLKALRKRRAAQGLIRHEHYYHKEDHYIVVKFVSDLNNARLKDANLQQGNNQEISR